MRELIEQIRLEEADWKQKVAAGALALGLATGAPNVAQAATHHHHHQIVHKTYTVEQVITAIAGEAGTYEGMLAVADVIRNRLRLPGEYRHNILHGVAGLHAKFLKHESPKRFELAKKAWENSRSVSIIGDAYLWGNDSDLNKWRSERGFDFNKLEFIKKVEGNNFFKYKR